MSFDKTCEILAGLSENFKLGLFDRQCVQPLLEEALDESDRWHRRVRRLPAPLMLWFVPLLSLFRDLSIPDVFKTVVNALRERRPELALQQVTPEALCKARKRLGWEPVRVLFEKLVAQLVQPVPTFRGLRVLGLDGSRFKVPDTEENEAAFGRPGAARGRTGFPQLQGVFLVSAWTHEILRAVFGRCDDGERELGLKLVEGLGEGDLVTLDRGFAAGWCFQHFLERGVHILCRIPENWRPLVLEVLGPGDTIVWVKTQLTSPEERLLGRRSRREHVRMRMIEYQIGDGPMIRLVTDLLDPERYPAAELAALYHERWECEVVYDELKIHLATVPHGTMCTAFRSKTPDGVRQEAYGLLIAYNLVRAMMVEAARERGIPPREISFLQTLRVLRLALPRFQWATPEQAPWLYKQLFQDIAACRLDRPRRPRSYPRKVKVKMSNYQVKGPGDKEKRLEPAPILAEARTTP